VPKNPTSIELVESFIERRPWNRRWFSFALAALLMVVDYFSVPYDFAPTYFILPPMLVAWHWGAREGVALALGLSATHLLFQQMWGMPGLAGAASVNALMRICVLLVLVVITSRLGRRTRASRARVKMLEGILPICAYCKDIRDEHGQWEQIEEYVSQHSEAHFSHGICPKCAESHFGEYRRDKTVGH
jgi:hypothetical protein